MHPKPSRDDDVRTLSIDPEKDAASDTDLASPVEGLDPTTSIHNLAISFERPKVAGLVETAIITTASDRRVLVMACGPEGLMKQVRNTTAASIRKHGPSVELHCEQFGW
jgi:ferredoxin-NADP reductase